MNFKDMTTDQLLERRSAIATEIEAPDADLNALEAEARAINEELEARRAAAAQRENVRGMVAQGAGTVIASAPQEQRTVQTDEEVRASARYCDAWKNYIINGDPSECRSLLTTNASGAVPVPTILEAGIQTAWENDPIMSRVRRTYIRGNLKVAFELSADGAYVHTEGTTAPTEESLTLGIVELIPANVKKWIKISDEAIAMGGEAFVQYIYDEMGYRVLNKLVSELVGKANSAATTHGDTAIGMKHAKIAETVSVTSMNVQGFALVGGRAENRFQICRRHGFGLAAAEASE